MTTARYATALTGGAAGALDAKSVATLADGDIAWVATGTVLYVYKFVAAATDSEASPGRIRPDDYSTAGVWYLQSVGDTAPVGSVIALPYATVPSGYLECDGSSLLRASYSALFAVISDDYGAADGTHFNLPDYRGKFLRGWAHGQTTDPDKATRTDRGDGTGGDVVGSKQADEIASHTHQYHDGGYDSGGSTYTEGSVNQNSPRLYTSAATGGSETRPKNVNVMYCIKY
jgi:microcystin-dependent protein